MPDGEKVGDAYIEVRYEVDDKSIKKVEGQTKKAVEAAEKTSVASAKKAEADKLKIIEQSVKAQISREKQKQDALDKNFKDQVTAVNRLAALKKTEEERSYALFEKRIAARNRTIERQKVIELKAEKDFQTEKTRIIEKFTRDKKRFKDGGVAGLGETLENAASILPGQLEKLLRNPVLRNAAGLAGVELMGMIGAAMAGATALAVLGGGLAAAISADKELQEAGTALGIQVLTGFQDVAVKEMKPAIQESFSFLEDSGFASRISGNFKAAFAAVAGELPTFTADLAETIDGITKSIGDLVSENPELITAMGQGFKQFGNAAESVFNQLKENGPGIELLLGDVFATISGITRGFGKVIDFASSLRVAIQGAAGDDPRSIEEKFGNSDDLAAASAGYQRALDNLTAARVKYVAAGKPTAELDEKIKLAQAGLAGVTAESARRYNLQRQAALAASGATGTMSAANQKLAEDTRLASEAIQDQIDAERMLSDETYRAQRAAIDFAQAESDLKTQFKGNNDTIAVNTQRGRDNRKALVDQFKAARDVAQGILEAGGSAKEANAKFKELTDKTILNTGATGKNKTEMQKLRGEYTTFKAIPDITKNIKIVVPNVGTTQAIFDNLTKSEQKIITVVAQKKGISAAQMENQIRTKNSANGGYITGPGTATSDSIPARLSNGEFVIKASSVKSIGVSTLNAMNASGQMAIGRANGGPVGYRRGGKVDVQKFRSQSNEESRKFGTLQADIKTLTATIKTQTSALTRWTDTYNDARGQFASFVNLGRLDTEGKSAGSILQQLKAQKGKASQFSKDLGALKKLGLSATALQQISDAGPDSDLARILTKGLGKADVAGLNSLLGGDKSYADSIATTLRGKKPSVSTLNKNKASLASKKKAAAKLKAPRARGASIKYAGGKTYAMLSKKEIADQQFRANQYVTVIIDGKEVRAIVKQEQTKAAAKTNRKVKSGRR